MQEEMEKQGDLDYYRDKTCDRDPRHPRRQQRGTKGTWTSNDYKKHTFMKKYGKRVSLIIDCRRGLLGR